MTNTIEPTRFAILRHDGIDSPHFDLMLETSPHSKLTTWRSPNWPIDHPTILTRLPDHRRAYLDYEGPLSANRGFVKRIATGTCRIDHAQDDRLWSIHFADPFIPPLNIKHDNNDQWLAVPACG